MRFLRTLLVAGLVFVSCKPTSDERPPRAPEPARAATTAAPSFGVGNRLLKAERAVSGRYIVALEDEAASPTQVGLLARQLSTLHGASMGHVYSRAFHGFSATMSEAAAVQLSNDPRVRYVEEDSVVALRGTQAPAPWNLDRIDQRALPLDQAYHSELTGSGVHAYVIDTGIRFSHSEFGGRAVPGFTTVADGNGSIDCHGHGTHVAGIVGGATYGVAKGVTLHAVRVMDCTGSGTVSDLIAGIDWVTANAALPAVAVISLSANGSSSLDEAVTRSIDAGVAYAVSAGDDGTLSACSWSPGRVPAALTVGATDIDDGRAFFSDTGDCVDLLAPGSNILSAWSTTDTSTNTLSGTSMSAAHVAGVAALYLQAHPQASPGEVSTGLVTHAIPGAYSTSTPLLFADANWVDLTPPQVSLALPIDGATVGGRVTLSASATDPSGISRVDFFFGNQLIGSVTAPPFTLTWNSLRVRNGPGVFTARAYDTHYNPATSAPVGVTFSNPGEATFDPTWGTPVCATVGNRCDSGGLLAGRGDSGPELHQPNTVLTGGSCLDGTGGTYLTDPSLERLLVYPSDGSTFQAGKEVTVEATVVVYANPFYAQYQYLDLFAAADANNPTWTHLTTLWASGVGLQTFSFKYLLPQGGMQVVRGVYRFGGRYSDPCDNQGWSSDHDDLVFAVAQTPDTEPPSVAITAPVEGATVDSSTLITLQASDALAVQRVELYAGSTLLNTFTQPGPTLSWSWSTRALANGPYTLTARAYDVAGNTSQSTVNVLVDNDVTPPQQPVITAPASGASVSGTVSLEVSASDDRRVARVDFFLDGVFLGSDSTVPFSLAWDSSTVFNGSHTLSVKSYDPAGQSTASAPVTFEASNPGNARFDPVLTVPRCDIALARCDSRNLLTGRGPYGPEPHAPNTLDGCADGTLTDMRETVGAIRVIREDGTALAAGKRVLIEVDVTVTNLTTSVFDRLELFSAADALQPVWTPIAVLAPSMVGKQTLSTVYVLPAGGLQAIRAAFGLGLNGTCGAGHVTGGSTNDRDDLVFAVNQETDSAPPQVSLTAPVNGATLTQTVLLSATASDDFGVVAVDFYDGETLIGSDSSEPYGLMWNTRTAANGVHALTARARDLAGHGVSTQPVTVTVDNDVTAPVVSLTEPAAGARLTGYVHLSANASDDRGVTRVEFYDGGQLLGTSSAAPYGMVWPSQSGTHTLSARAYDAAGNVGTSASVTVTVVPELTPPTVAITSPTSGTVTSTSLMSIYSSADDASGLSLIEIFVDGTFLASNSYSPWVTSWDTRTAAAGFHTLTARATDIYGNVATSSPVSVALDRAPPSVSLASPTGGTGLSGVISLQANATDDTAVTRVDFFADGSLVSSDTTAPYAADWDSTTAADGTHTLTAKAYDALDHVTTSAPVTVSTQQPVSAVFDATLEVPRCSTPMSVCDTTNLVPSGSYNEPHGPNTINATCSDGPVAYAHAIQRIKLSTVSGAIFGTGQRVRIDVFVNTWDTTQDALDLFIASDATQPAWTLLTTLQSGVVGAQMLSTEYVLSSGQLQAVRAQFRRGGDNSSACNSGSSYADRDDVAFAVDSAPVVALTAPANNALVKGQVSLAATTVSSQPVTKVEFYDGTTLLGTSTSAPYGLSWNSAAGADGAHTLSAKAYDTVNRVGTSPALSVTVDNTPPPAALTSPAPGAFLRGSVALTATATDNQTVSKVEFYDGATLLGSVTNSPYTLSWNTSGATSGAHTLTVKAYDSAGNVGTSSGVGVNVDNTAPVTNLSAPANNSQVRGLVQVSATASDNLGVARVEFSVDGSLVGTSTNSPYGLSWNSASVADGSHSISVKAYDAAGNVSAPATVLVSTDNTPPVAALTSPIQGSLVRGSVSLAATASDNTTVSKVEFYDGATLIGSSTSSPYALSWNTAGVADGTHTLTVKAYDGVGNTSTSGGVNVSVDNTAPATALSAPATNAQLRGTVQVSATASDNEGVARVEFYVGTTLLGTVTTAPYAVDWDTTSVTDGAVTLTTRAYDTAGNVAVSAGRSVVVNNTPPTVAITSPANGATLSSLSLFATLQASASDSVGVTQVVFYDGGAIIGTDTTAPYSVSWNLLSASKGAHTLTARAYDGAGNTTISAPISVTVK